MQFLFLICLAHQMDADYDESQAVNQNMQQGGRKRKGRSRFSCVVRQEKPVFDPSMKRFLSFLPDLISSNNLSDNCFGIILHHRADNLDHVSSQLLSCVVVLSFISCWQNFLCSGVCKSSAVS